MLERNWKPQSKGDGCFQKGLSSEVDRKAYEKDTGNNDEYLLGTHRMPGSVLHALDVVTHLSLQ